MSTTNWAGRRARNMNEQGAVAIVVALSTVALVVVAAMVLDFGAARLDRQSNKAAADAAVTAGMRGLDQDNGQIFSYRGACAALAYLKANEPKLSSWTEPACSNAADLAKVCNPDPVTGSSTWAHFTWPSANGFHVEIQAPYDLATSGFPEESKPALAADKGDPLLKGCDQIAVTVTQTRKPGLGSLATPSSLVTRIRSVGRVAVGPGNQAPALLLLERQRCQVLKLAAGGPGADSHIYVHGAAAYMAKRLDGTPGMVNQPGSIHADTNASDCPSGQYAPPVFLGKATDGIVAYAAPDLSVPGIITSVAGLTFPATTVRDSLINVYGSTLASGSGGQTEPTGRAIVTRKLVDERYLGGVTAAVTGARIGIFDPSTGVTATNAASKGYIRVNDCDPSAALLTGLGVTPLSKVYVDCTGNPGFKGTAPIVAQEVIFNGQIASSANVSVPYAQRVYVFGTGADAIDASTGFSMNTAGNLAANPSYPTGPLNICKSTTNASKAMLFVNDGGIKATGGLLQLCNTTVIMLNGQPNACLPTVGTVAPPTSSPCSSGAGNGRFKIAGTATQDWTAPNQYDDMSLMTDSQKKAAWEDTNGLEDLALWSESYGTSSDWQMSGGGLMHTVGVFMTPNAAPFVVKGDGTQTLNNAQYIATSFELTGGATLNMTVDPNNAIPLPALNPFTLVR